VTKTPTPQRNDPPPAADGAAQDANADADADALKDKSIGELARMGRALYAPDPQPRSAGKKTPGRKP
jgi:hypothetical protein